MHRKPVLMDIDGGVDDLLSLMLLLTMPHLDVRGITVTPADCFLDAALEATAKILTWMGHPEIPVAAGDLYGINAFPPEWRAQPRIINAFPMMLVQQFAENAVTDVPARTFLAEKICESVEPVTILMTGPASNLVAALEAQPSARKKITEIVWMAGAIDVPGNVRSVAHDGSAEWNAYWDPISARKLLEMRLPLTLFPLDATNHVPVSLDFLQTLAQQREHQLSAFAGQCWATTVNTIPHYDYQYFMWDMLATGYLGCPEAISFRKMVLQVKDSGKNAGQMMPAPGSGQWVTVAQNVDVSQFHQYVLRQFCTPILGELV